MTAVLGKVGGGSRLVLRRQDRAHDCLGGGSWGGEELGVVGDEKERDREGESMGRVCLGGGEEFGVVGDEKERDREGESMGREGLSYHVWDVSVIMMHLERTPTDRQTDIQTDMSVYLYHKSLNT